MIMTQDNAKRIFLKADILAVIKRKKHNSGNP